MQRQLDRLSREAEATARDALKKLAFDVRDDVQDHAASALTYSGPSTQKFIARGFKVRYRSTGSLFTALVYPLKRSAAILAKHVSRYLNRPDRHEDVVVHGRIAIPAGFVRRSRRGKVKPSHAPARWLERDAQGRARGFISKAGFVMARRTKKAEPKLAFVFADQTVNPPRLDVQAAAGRSVRKRAGQAFARAIRSAMRRSGVR